MRTKGKLFMKGISSRLSFTNLLKSFYISHFNMIILFFMLSVVSLNATSYEYMDYKIVIDNSSPNSLPIDALKIYIKNNGLYKLTYSDFTDKGLDPAVIDFNKVALYNKGVSRPFMLIGYEDGKFEQGDMIIFFAERLSGKYSYRNWYTDYNTYFLYFNQGGESGRIARHNFAEVNYPDKTVLTSRTEHFEKDTSCETFKHFFGMPTDFSFYLPISWASGKNIRTVNFALPGFDPFSSLSTGVKVFFYGKSAVITSGKYSHTLSVKIGTNLIGECKWDYAKEYIFENRNVQTRFFNGYSDDIVFSLLDNTVVPDDIMLDWFEITYPVKLEAISNAVNFVTQKDASKQTVKITVQNFKDNDVFVFNKTKQEYIIPTVLSDGGDKYKAIILNEMALENEYYLSGKSAILIPDKIDSFISRDLKNPNNSANYLIVTHEDFLAQSQLLANFREKHGLKSIVMTITQLYDEFYNGIPDEEAYKEAFKYMYQNWGAPTLRYVLLMGDFSSDWYNIGNYQKQNFVPTHYNPDPFGDYATDIWFGDFLGNDYSPEVVIGRLPVKTQQEADDVVYKIINYEMNFTLSFWRYKATISASADFTDYCEDAISSYLANKFYVQKIYVGPTINGTQLIIDSVVNGTGFLAFVGHGARYLWWTGQKKFASSFDEVTGNFTPESVDVCVNPTQIPLLFGITCFNNNFDNPNPRNCIGEKFILKRDGGAIASFGTSGFSNIENDKIFAENLFYALFQDNLPLVGDIFLYASQVTQLGSTKQMFVLLGDPASPHPLIPLK